MPHPTKEMLIATAFNRNHPPEYGRGRRRRRVSDGICDRPDNTFGNAFLGLTVGCAKCHDHKYDPISQKSYYELFSFFNNVKEAGQISFDDAMPTPTSTASHQGERKGDSVYECPFAGGGEECHDAKKQHGRRF